MQFIYNLVRYYQARQNNVNGVPIHSDTLISWSCRDTYQRRINELEKKGIISRSSRYVNGLESKRIHLFWEYFSDEETIQNINGTPNTINEAITLSFTSDELHSKLKKLRLTSSNIKRIVANTYE
jgi:hypothetical protein